MAIVTLFGPPEPATSKVTGTARAINYLPKINQAGVLCWVQRPGLAVGPWPWDTVTDACIPVGSFVTPSFEYGDVGWNNDGLHTLTSPTLLLVGDGAGFSETAVIDYVAGAEVTKDILITYKNSANSRISIDYNDEYSFHGQPIVLTETTATLSNKTFTKFTLRNTAYGYGSVYIGDPIPDSVSWIYCVEIRDPV